MVTAKYLVDSDWAIFYLRGREPFVTALKEYRQQGLAINVVTVAELYEGVFRSPDPEEKERTLINFLNCLSVIDVSSPVARLFGRRRAEFRVKGITVSDFDLMIGCTAEYCGLAIITNNRKHFEGLMALKDIISLPV